jgi:hypothetical protein
MIRLFSPEVRDWPTVKVNPRSKATWRSLFKKNEFSLKIKFDETDQPAKIIYLTQSKNLLQLSGQELWTKNKKLCSAEHQEAIKTLQYMPLNGIAVGQPISDYNKQLKNLSELLFPLNEATS